MTSYLGLICVVSTEGSLLCFNSDLQPLTAYGVSITGETPNLCVTDGNLYISTLFGVQSIDLVDLLQSEGLENRQGNVAPRTGKEVLETRKVTLTEQPALSPMSTVGNSIYGVVTGNGLCCWTGQSLNFKVALPDLDPKKTVLPPVIVSGFAFIVQRGGQQVQVVDLAQKRLSMPLDCRGTVLFATPAGEGMALLLQQADGRRVISLAIPARISVGVSALDDDISWIAASTRTGKYVWGDGSRCFIQTSRGTHPLDVQGNIGIVQIHEERGWALLETAEGSSAISIDLSQAQVSRPEALHDSSFTDFTVSGNRLIASNGREIRSVSLA